MRDIKFRGKDSEGKWIYGSYLQTKGLNFICKPISKFKTRNYLIQNKDTISQYTELKDKNGTEIYEGDIILTQPFRDKPYSKNYKSKRLHGIVKFHVSFGRNFRDDLERIRYWGSEWDVEIIEKKDLNIYKCWDWGLFYDCEVVGNIYDNPELVGE